MVDKEIHLFEIFSRFLSHSPAKNGSHLGKVIGKSNALITFLSFCFAHHTILQIPRFEIKFGKSSPSVL